MWLIDRLFNRKIEGESSLDPLANKVKVDGDEVSIDGTLRAKNVVEEGDTELIDLKSYVNTGFAKSNTFYAKGLVKHGVLHIVISGKFVAGDSAGVNNNILNNFAGALPESVRSKIYRADGTNISESPSSVDFADTFVAGSVCVKRVGSTINSSSGILISQGANSLLLSGYGFGTIAEDTNCILDMRIALTI